MKPYDKVTAILHTNKIIPRLFSIARNITIED